MSSEVDEFTQKLLERTKARRDALQQKMQEHSFQTRKRRPLEEQVNKIDQPAEAVGATRVEESIDNKAIATSESPTKRSKLNNASTLPVVVKSGNGVIQKPIGEKTVSEKMKKLANQKRLFDAADQGEDVDFGNIPSPISHDPQSPAPGMPSNRKVDMERKARLAALAMKVSSWEDGFVSSDDILSLSPEKAKPSAVDQSSDIDKQAQPMETSTQNVSLSVETLTQFACKNQNPVNKLTNQQETQIKVTVHQKYGNNKIMVGSCRKDLEDEAGYRQLTPTIKSLHQTLIQLQKNGCKEKQTKAKLIAEEEKTLQEESSTKELKENSEKDNHITSKDMGCSESSSAVIQSDVQSKPDSSKIDDSDNEDDLEEQSESDNSNFSYGDSMMENLDGAPGNSSSLIKELENLRSSENRRSWPEDTDLVSLDEDSSGSSITLIENDLSFSVEEEGTTGMIASTPDGRDAQLSRDEDEIDDLFVGVEVIDEDDDTFKSPDTTSSSKSPPTRFEIRENNHSESVQKQFHQNDDVTISSQHAQSPAQPATRAVSTFPVPTKRARTVTDVSQDFPVFTIDSYRSEKRNSVRHIQKKIVRNENLTPSHKRLQTKSPQELSVQLLQEVQLQQRVIQQASAALDCCYDTHHGKGSVTELEAEKLLLIASEKRLALQEEIQKLKEDTSYADKCSEPQSCRGKVTLDHIQLPLKSEYIFSAASKKDGGESKKDYYFILVRCGALKIFASHLASISESLSGESLGFRDKFEINDLKSNFEICVEVYSANPRARVDSVSNQEKSKSKLSGILQKGKAVEVKKIFTEALQITKERVKQATTSISYPISKTSDSSASESLTPRKKSSRSSQSSPSRKVSTSGSNPIRCSSFTLIGSLSINLSDLQRKKFTLQKVPFLSAITGHLACRLTTDFQSNAKQNGFLTMFNDVGGLGAWHRRWCALRYGTLYSWTYPDDERRKEPLSKLELRECISGKIRTVDRLMCARPNTIELRTMRPRKQGDKENLISHDTGSVIQTKHWLAADTKEERNAWIDTLNQSLIDVRAWDATALKPLS